MLPYHRLVHLLHYYYITKIESEWNWWCGYWMQCNLSRPCFWLNILFNFNPHKLWRDAMWWVNWGLWLSVARLSIWCSFFLTPAVGKVPTIIRGKRGSFHYLDDPSRRILTYSGIIASNSISDDPHFSSNTHSTPSLCPPTQYN